MPEINLPEVKLPDFKMPDGLRDMSREDIVNAARDVRLPKRIEMPDFDLSKVEMPKAIADRMPNRKRSNPLVPIAGFLAIGAMIAAAWWLITSPMTGPRIRSAVSDLKARMNGEPTDVIRYDDDKDLGSLLPDESGTLDENRYASTPVVADEMAEAIRSN